MRASKILGLVGASFLASFIASSAIAGPITVLGGTLTSDGVTPVKAAYVFSDAADVSYMYLPGYNGNAPIFCNGAAGPCLGASPIAAPISLGVLPAGALDFNLNNLSIATNYHFLTPDGFGDFHVLVTANPCDFYPGCALPGPLSAAIATLSALPGSWVYVGWEDRNQGIGSDFDYNDLIFAFQNVGITTIPTPEPVTLSLMGAGLAGLGALRRRRKKSA